MTEVARAGKLPAARQFRDLSDYAGPLAVRLARGLRDTRVRAPAVTVVWGMIGLVGAACYAVGGYWAAVLGAAALQAKNILDAVDGSLARLQQRPSRVGRFLDSVGDAVVAAAVYIALGIAVARARPDAYAGLLATAALLLGLLQGSAYNHFYVRARKRWGGDTTSRVTESLTAQDREHYAGRPAALGLLRLLLLAYAWIYGWQDAVIQRIDRWAAAPLVQSGRGDEADELRDDRRLLTALSALGPGLQILVLNLYTLAGYQAIEFALELYLWTVALGGTLVCCSLFLRLRFAAARLTRASGRG